jgi:hypothetical protein
MLLFYALRGSVEVLADLIFGAVEIRHIKAKSFVFPSN